MLDEAFIAERQGNKMRILDILECASRQGEAGPVAGSYEAGQVAIPLMPKQIADPLVRELDDFIQSSGFHLSKYLATDEVALAYCIVATAKQADDYRMSPDVEKFVRYLFSKATLAKAVA